MRRLLSITGLIAAVLLLGVAVGWLATRKPVSGTPLGNIESLPKPEIPSHAPFFPTNSRAHRTEVSNKVVAQSSVLSTNLITDWEQKIDDILGPEGDETAKAKQMLALFPRLPEEGQVEVAQHVSNLLPDEQYAPLGKMLTDPKLPEAVLDVLMVDVLNRPNSLKLPLLLEVARDPQHPKAAEAKDLMELYLEEDYGTDWNKWQAKLKLWLQENPD